MRWHFFILFFILLPSVLSVGILTPADKVMIFSPGGEKTFTYVVVNAPKIGTFLSGDLAEYGTILDPAPETGQREVKLLVKLPQTLEPGTYILYFGVNEIAEIQGTVGGLASTRSPIKIVSLYAGKYPQFSLSIPDINVNEPIKFNVGVINYGTEIINVAYADIELFDPDNNSIAKTRTNANSVGSYQSINLEGKINSKDYNLQPGIYHATARLTYDGTLHKDVPEVTFNIGTLNVYVTQTTEEVIFNATNRYQVWIESDWSGNIDNVYAKITMPNGKTLKTPNVDLIKPGANMAKAQAILETYWETQGLAVGEYDLFIELNYKGKTTSHTAKIKIIEGVAPIVEKPKGFQVFSVENKDGKTSIVFMNMSMPLMIFLMVLLVIGVIINVCVILTKKPHEDEKTGVANANNIKSATAKSSGGLKPPKL